MSRLRAGTALDPRLLSAWVPRPGLASSGAGHPDFVYAAPSGHHRENSAVTARYETARLKRIQVRTLQFRCSRNVRYRWRSPICNLSLAPFR
jgi:hypothetical protein